ncbi:glycosyltransferase family 2 protein [Streptococcus thermophilus]|nr:glycosyltransferase family 2 protein [Streptococcus thermophilus]MCE2308797.1 glycosyltransferase [Streptococcus thermophilus]MCE2312150.1 glycosyltransferase [Streptococcus thermophilus]MCE2313348.1 glycosyltransferase [Streptococcus thermophilus]MCE2315174.1 glycosyltransferase [Streptococcus thermophilus]MCE2318856.1 glycosyltransferase [Streptococcus thermophilus]
MDISAGIVLFNPDIKRLKENIDAVIIQCTHLYLVDNGSGNVDEVKGLLNQYNQSKISILWNRENQGIAKALNQLTSAAQKEGFDWILTLDQDSVVPSNIVGEFEKYINNSSVGILCPIICDRNKDEEIKINEDCTEIDECITSGSLLNIKAWSEIGGFDERMFIDGVDFDICYRLRQRGYKIYCIHSVVLLHELGHIEYHRFLFWKVLVKNHSAFRKYYIARNIIYVAKKRKSVLLAIKGILQEVKLLGIVLLYETDKKSKSISIIKGIRDGAMLNTKKKEL